MNGEASAFFSPETEKALLGIAMQDAGTLKTVTDTSDGTFCDPRHLAILAGMRDLVRAGTPVDLVTLDNWLSRSGRQNEAGGTAYLMECMQAGWNVSGAGSYLSILNECAMRRRLRKIGSELIERCASMEDPEDIRDWASRTVKELRMGDTSRLISMQEATMAAYAQIESDQRRDDQPTGRIFSGIAKLDEKLGGLHGGEYVAIGARPSVGKSILALTFCVNAARQGKRVLLVSLEMDEVQITERVFADQSGVTMGKITSDHVTAEEWSMLATAAADMSRLPLWYCLDATTVDKVRRAAYQLYESGGLDMIAVDYLQLMEATYAKRQNRQEQIAEISRGLRLLAAELKIPILVLTQLNRSSVSERVDGKKVKREPTMSEARESGSIEQDANIFILLHDPGKDEMENEVKRRQWEALKAQGLTMLWIIIDKNRQGKKGRVTAAFDGDHMRLLSTMKGDMGDDSGD